MKTGSYIVGTSTIPLGPYFPVGLDCLLYHAYWDGTVLDHSQYGINGNLYGDATFVENGLNFGSNGAITKFENGGAGITTVTSNNHGLTIDTGTITKFENGGTGGSITKFEIAAQGAITKFEDNGSGTTRVTSNNHGLTDYLYVTISSTTNYNGIWVISAVTTNTFDIDALFVGDDATGTWILTATRVTSNNHGLANGSNIVISSTTNYNGPFTISNVTTNTFDIGAGFVSDDATGTWVFGPTKITSNNHGLVNNTVVTISGTTNYNSIFTISNVTTNTFEINTSFVGDDATGIWIKLGSSVSISGTTNYDGTFNFTNPTTNTFDINTSFVGDDATGIWMSSGVVNNYIPAPLRHSYPNSTVHCWMNISSLLSQVTSQGTLTLSDIPSVDETFTIGNTAFTWVVSRSGTGEVTVGGNVTDCYSNIVDAITADEPVVIASLIPFDGGVLVTAFNPGVIGNTIPFDGSGTANIVMNGDGSLGGTTLGSNTPSISTPWQLFGNPGGNSGIHLSLVIHNDTANFKEYFPIIQYSGARQAGNPETNNVRLLPYSQWVLVTVAVTSPNVNKYYINGVLLTTVSRANAITWQSGVYLRIGSDGIPPSAGWKFYGIIGEFLFFNDTQTGGQILTYYNETKTRYGR